MLRTMSSGLRFSGSMRRRFGRVLAVVTGTMLGAISAASLPSAAEPGCRAPAALSRLDAPLPATKRAVSAGVTTRIVALGSSSTQGTGASNPRMCYPVRLEAELNRRFAALGEKSFEVINLGIGGQLADNMLARLDTEVLPLKPSLVIWQTGVNDVIRGVPLEDFRTTLAQGIDAIRDGGADVVLLDSQYYPNAAKVQGFKEYLTAMREIARDKGVSIFSRYKVMKHLIDSAQFTAAQLLAPDQFHLNDLSYGCLGSVMADAIGEGIERSGKLAHAR